jgi:hypothetical protein
MDMCCWRPASGKRGVTRQRKGKSRANDWLKEREKRTWMLRSLFSSQHPMPVRVCMPAVPHASALLTAPIALSVSRDRVRSGAVAFGPSVLSLRVKVHRSLAMVSGPRTTRADGANSVSITPSTTRCCLGAKFRLGSCAHALT